MPPLLRLSVSGAVLTSCGYRPLILCAGWPLWPTGLGRSPVRRRHREDEDRHQSSALCTADAEIKTLPPPPPPRHRQPPPPPHSASTATVCREPGAVNVFKNKERKKPRLVKALLSSSFFLLFSFSLLKDLKPELCQSTAFSSFFFFFFWCGWVRPRRG